MPWSARQVRAAYAVKGGAKVGGMTQAFASQVIAEGVKGGAKPKRKSRGTIRELLESGRK